MFLKPQIIILKLLNFIWTCQSEFTGHIFNVSLKSAQDLVPRADKRQRNKCQHVQQIHLLLLYFHKKEPWRIRKLKRWSHSEAHPASNFMGLTDLFSKQLYMCDLFVASSHSTPDKSTIRLSPMISWRLWRANSVMPSCCQSASSE